ncbi:MAG: Group 1 glycosyl transferase [Microgenomates group bacterium Gr01-1014_16]|nr:MAG: Group 1 glycosyl transferase [Microgenomates group bacterium Gr01-1014_16]
MKVALVHDYLKEIGGAERVLMALHEIFPDAPVYTAYKFPKYWGHYKDELEKWDIRESWGRWLPFLPKWLSYYTILSPLFFSTMDLSEYDLVIISATGGYFPNGVKVGPKTKVITYCHTPPRFLYGYETATQARHKWYWKVQSAIANHILRMVDFRWAQKPTVFVANSKNVANRVRKFYRRDAVVVYPPISKTSPQPLSSIQERGDYYLIVSRIVGTKNVELAVEAARKYKFKLKIAGKMIGGSRPDFGGVEYLGEVSEEEKYRLMAGAKAFLALSKDEDFGITPVESMMCGTPVIAYRAGGYLETVVDGKTGMFFEELTPEGLYEAIGRVGRIRLDRTYIKKWAGKFSKENFKKQMLRLVDAGIARN